MSINLGWYIPTKNTPPRWVLAVSKTHVLYGNGGSRHRECKVKTFMAWMRRTKAEVATNEHA